MVLKFLVVVSAGLAQTAFSVGSAGAIEPIWLRVHENNGGFSTIIEMIRNYDPINGLKGRIGEFTESLKNNLSDRPPVPGASSEESAGKMLGRRADSRITLMYYLLLVFVAVALFALWVYRKQR